MILSEDLWNPSLGSLEVGPCTCYTKDSLYFHEKLCPISLEPLYVLYIHNIYYI